MTCPQLLAASPQDVLSFWREAGPSRWFRKNAGFDTRFRERFLGAHEEAAEGAHEAWTRDADGALALLLLLDQFPRNAFRGSPRMYATDLQARRVAGEAIRASHDRQTEAALRNFFYLPLVHSESLVDQDRAVLLTRALGDEPYRNALEHRAIIERFGRFPHRNALLGRTTTPEERRFLEDGGFAG